MDERMENYRSRLHPNDKEDFDERFEEEYSDLDVAEIRDELHKEYQQSEDHLDLVVAIASGFHQTPLAEGYQSGYEFAFSEPLEERNSEFVGDEEVKNGDVLLVKEDDGDVYLCVVECKAGSNAGRDWVNELEGIEETLSEDQYRETLKSQIGAEDDEIRHIQYVLAGRVSEIFAMNYDEIEDDLDIPPNYAFWGYDLGDQALVHIYGEVRDQDLMSVIADSIDTGKVANPIQFTYSDHPLTQLKALIEEMITTNQQENDPHPYEFTKFEFRDTFEQELHVGFSGDVWNELVEKKTEYLLEIGTRIGILTNSSRRLNSNRDYRILFRGSRSKAAKKAAQEKYFEWRTKEKRKERAFEEVKGEFEARPAQTSLDSEQFWQDDGS